MESFVKVKDASMKERLKALDKEIAVLYLKCKEAGYDANNINNIAFPLIHVVQRGCWKIRAKRFVVFILFLGIIAGLSQWKLSNRACGVVYKKMMVNYVLPHYDWTWLWEDECLLNNPYYDTAKDDSLDEDQCAACENLKNISTRHDVTLDFMSDAIFRKEPTIIADATQEWPSIIQPVSLDGILQMYIDSPSLRGSEGVSDLHVSRGITPSDHTVRGLYQAIKEEQDAGRPTNFTAYWANIRKISSREIHKLYHQPYFLPGMCEPARDKNFVLLGRKSPIKSKALMFQLYDDDRGVWIAQLHGSMEIVLKPSDACSEVCRKIRLLLPEGHILNLPDHDDYEVGFRPGSDEFVAIAVSYTYD